MKVSKLRSSFIRLGLPMMVLLVGGSFGLREFNQLRYQFRKSKVITQAEAKELGVEMRPKEDAPTLEREYERLQTQELDTWQNIRGPRPWEDSKEVQDMQREQQSQS